MANSRGGLSKREYAAKQAGGTLNYKTGVVKVAAKKAPVKSTTTSASSSKMSSQPFDYSQAKSTGGFDYSQAKSVPFDYSQAKSTPAYDFSTAKSSPNKSSSGSSKSRPTTSTQTFADSFRTVSNPIQRDPVTHTDPNEFNARRYTGTEQGQANPSKLGVYLSSLKKQSPLLSSIGEQGFTEALGLNKYLRPLRAEASGYPQDAPLDQALAPEAQGVDQSQQEVVPEAQNSGIDWSKIATDSMGNPAAQGGGGGGATTDAFGVASTGGSNGSGGKKDKRGDDPYSQYAKMLEAARERQEDAFRAMLDQVDPTYEGYKNEYNTALEKSRFNEKQQLLAQQMAYGTADSEQRAQAEERLALEFADKQAAFSKQLADRENASRAEIGLQRANSLSSLDMKGADSALEAYKYQKTLEQQAFENEIAQMKLRAEGSGRSGANAYQYGAPSGIVAQIMQQYGVTQKTAEDLVKQQYGYDYKPQSDSASIWDVLMQQAANNQQN